MALGSVHRFFETDPLLQVTSQLARAICQRARGNHDASERLLSAAHELVVELGSRHLECKALLELGRLERARGDEAARDRLESARQTASSHGIDRFARLASEAQSEL